MAPNSSTLAWKIPWMEEPGRLQSMGLLHAKSRTRLSDFTLTFMHWRRKWQPTPVFLPGESQGRGSLVGCRRWGRRQSDKTEVTYIPGFHFFFFNFAGSSFLQVGFLQFWRVGAPLSLGFSRQEHWSGLPFPSPVRESDVAQSCPTLSDPMDCSPPVSSIHGMRANPTMGILEKGMKGFTADSNTLI